MQLEIRPPIGNRRGPLATESLLRAIHRAAPSIEPMTLRILYRCGSVGIAATVPDHLRTLFLQELQDAYPGVTVSARRIDDTAPASITIEQSLGVSPDFSSLRTYDAFLDLADGRHFTDPIAALLSAVRFERNEGQSCEFIIELQPATEKRLKWTLAAFERCSRGFRSQLSKQLFLTWRADPRRSRRIVATVLGKLARHGKAIVLDDAKFNEPLFECRLTVRVSVPKVLLEQANRKRDEIVATLGRFNADARLTEQKRTATSLLSAREIATLWHPPTASGDSVARLQRTEFRELEPPQTLASRKGKFDQTTLGRVLYRRQRQQFGVESDDLRRHLLAIGKTGCGKSTFLFNLVRQQMEAGRGVVLLDPHGQLAEEILDVVPKHRTNDVIYLNTADRLAPVGFNPLVGPAGTDPTLIADGVLTSFKHVFGFDDGSAPRLLHIFRNSLLSIIGSPDASLVALQRLLVDAVYRKSVVGRVDNEAVRSFWLTEFNRWNERDRTQYIASLQNKLGAFTTNEHLRAILDCGQQGIQLRQVMDQSRILICNLSKGTFGHDASTLLGSLLLSSLQLAAMSRADIPEADRSDCVVVVDEFHSYLADGNTTMADALAESRKYRTSYVLSTQMLEQLDQATLAGVLGNCGSTLCMTVGPRDAEILCSLLGSGLTPDDLMRIPKYHAYLRLLINGSAHTFSMKTLPPPRYLPKRSDVVKRVSRMRYGQQCAGR